MKNSERSAHFLPLDLAASALEKAASSFHELITSAGQSNPSIIIVAQQEMGATTVSLGTFGKSMEVPLSQGGLNVKPSI